MVVASVVIAACAGQTTGAGGGGAGGDACNGPGHYEVGKEGGYKPCCAGLNEVVQQILAHDTNGTPTCIDAVGVRNSVCIAGTCGDGMCEVEEDVPCGCPQDCGDIAFTDAGSTDAGTN